MSMLLIDSCLNSNVSLTLNESANGVVKFRGKFQACNEANKNGRMYPEQVLKNNVETLNDIIKARGLVGELDHPTDSIVHFEHASHLITKLWWEGNSLMGEGEILSTPYGRTLRALLNDGVRVGISSRGVGNGKTNESGVLVISEGYKLITFDIVADPSTNGAFQEKIVATKESLENFPENNSTILQKNNNTSIHKVNKDALVACIGGIIKSHTSSLKERLG